MQNKKVLRKFQKIKVIFNKKLPVIKNLQDKSMMITLEQTRVPST